MKRIIVFLLILGLAGYIFRDKISGLIFGPRKSEVPQGVVSVNGEGEPVEDVEIVAEGLNIPWEIVFLPGGEILVTERPGSVVKIELDGSKKTIFSLSETEHVGEGGLLGMALHPNFEKNNFVFLYTTTDDGGLKNKVLRYTLENDEFSDRKVIVEGINGAANHDGGRIAFGPDGFLYATTGDAQSPDSAQNTDSLNGKILRVKDDGSGLEVYSYGHRNPQGLAWDGSGQLWATEHGPSGAETGNDELNLIKKGVNYGWPVIRGTQTRDGMITPVVESGRGDTWAPSGLAYLDGSLFFSGLRGSSLYEAKIDGDEVTDLKEHFKGEYGRIRAVVVGPDGLIYISTSNRDGRGSVNDGDDKIIRINPEIFE